MLEDCLTDLERIRGEISEMQRMMIKGYLVSLEARGFGLPNSLKELLAMPLPNSFCGDYIHKIAKYLKECDVSKINPLS